MKTEQEIIELNLRRLRLSMKDIFNLVPDNYKKVLAGMQVIKHTSDGKKKRISIMEIDFTLNSVFVCPEKIIGIISYIGMIKLNKVNLRDTTLSGVESRIHTSYMIANAVNAKMSLVNERYDDMEDTQVNNYFNKDLVIWTLTKLLGTGTERDAITCMNSMLSLYEQRAWSGKLNWLFFWGTKEEYDRIYALNAVDNIYEITTKTKVATNKIEQIQNKNMPRNEPSNSVKYSADL